MSFKNVEVIASSAVATSGTLTLSYPTNTNAGSFAAFGHKAWVDKFQSLLASPADFTLAFGASDITLTYLGATSIPVGARVAVQLNIAGTDNGEVNITDGTIDNAKSTAVVTIDLGAPVASDSDGVCASQSITAAGTGAIAGALATGGVATFDVPRNVVAAWTGTAVITITGTDEYGNVVVESSASGTSLAGKKAFKTVTAVDVSADVTGATVGTSKVLGLPTFLEGAAYIIKEIEDGAVATAGTVVSGVSTAATATTGDVRGTYSPDSTPNGTKVFKLIVASPDVQYKGVAQYAG